MTIENICINCQLVSTDKHDIVVSYGTPVLAILDREENGKMCHRRYWTGWSATTQRHINKCLDLYGLPHITKKEWEAMPIEWPDF